MNSQAAIATNRHRRAVEDFRELPTGQQYWTVYSSLQMTRNTHKTIIVGGTRFNGFVKPLAPAPKRSQEQLSASAAKDWRRVRPVFTNENDLCYFRSPPTITLK